MSQQNDAPAPITADAAGTTEPGSTHTVYVTVKPRDPGDAMGQSSQSSFRGVVSFGSPRQYNSVGVFSGIEEDTAAATFRARIMRSFFNRVVPYYESQPARGTLMTFEKATRLWKRSHQEESKCTRCTSISIVDLVKHLANTTEDLGLDWEMQAKLGQEVFSDFTVEEMQEHEFLSVYPAKAGDPLVPVFDHPSAHPGDVVATLQGDW